MFHGVTKELFSHYTIAALSKYSRYHLCTLKIYIILVNMTIQIYQYQNIQVLKTKGHT